MTTAEVEDKKEEKILEKIEALGFIGVKTFVKRFVLVLGIGAGLMVIALAILSYIR